MRISNPTLAVPPAGSVTSGWGRHLLSLSSLVLSSWNVVPIPCLPNECPSLKAEPRPLSPLREPGSVPHTGCPGRDLRKRRLRGQEWGVALGKGQACAETRGHGEQNCQRIVRAEGLTSRIVREGRLLSPSPGSLCKPSQQPLEQVLLPPILYRKGSWSHLAKDTQSRNMSLGVSEAKSHIFNPLCLAVLSKCLLMQWTVTVGETDLGTEQRQRHAPPPLPSEPWAPVPSNLGSQGHLQEDCSVHKHFRTINGQHYVPAGPGDPAPQMIDQLSLSSHQSAVRLSP